MMKIIASHTIKNSEQEQSRIKYTRICEEEIIFLQKKLKNVILDL